MQIVKKITGQVFGLAQSCQLAIGSVIVITALVSMGCASSNNRYVKPSLEQPGKPSMSALSDQRLRTLMNDLNDLVFEQLYTELELDRLRSRYALRIAELTQKRVVAIENLAQSENKLGLDQQEEQMFRKLTRQLHDQAQELEQLALAEQTENIRPALDRMIDTCNGCHQLFRGRGIRKRMVDFYGIRE